MKYLQTDPPNIFLIILDALRADRILYKYKSINLTPNIEKLLEHSFYFKNCIVNHTWTLPSHISISTGLYSSQIRSLGGELNKISTHLPVLPEILDDLCYTTIGYTENPWLSKVLDMDRGFNYYFKNFQHSLLEIKNDKFYGNKFLNALQNIIDKISSKKLKVFLEKVKKSIEKLNKRLIKTFFWKKQISEYPNTLENLEQVKQLLKREEESPFYVFFNLMATHSPYIPSIDILKSFNIKTNELNSIKDFLINISKVFKNINLRGKKVSKKQIESLHKFYNSCVYYADKLVGHFIQILKDQGLLNNSYIIITSDHGELLCDSKDHYLYGHGVRHSVLDSLIKVPLIIFNPRFKKKKFSEQVQLKDLFHTILDITGKKIKTPIYNKKKSILTQLTAKSTPEYIFGQHLKKKEKMNIIISDSLKYMTKEKMRKVYHNIYFLRSNQYKLIEYGDKICELFNLVKDPYEYENIIEKEPEVYQNMKEKINEYKTNTKNIDNLKYLITSKEKEKLNNVIDDLKII